MLLHISYRQISKIIWLIVAILSISHIAALLLDDAFGNRLTSVLVEKFSLEGEGNFPAFFSAVILLTSSLLFLLIAWASREYAKNGRSKYWFGLAATFLFLSLDEAAQIHEKLDTDLIWGAYDGTGVLAWPWVIIYSSLAVVFAIAYLRFWFNLPQPYRTAYLLTAILYVGSALGFEMLEAREFTMHQGETFLYVLYTTVEEFFEMSAITILIYTNMKYLAEFFPDVHFSFATDRVAETP